MTEAEWQDPSAVTAALAFVAGRDAPAGAIRPRRLMTERKLRLFLAGYCRWHRAIFAEPRAREAVEVVERFADGEATDLELLVMQLGTAQLSRERADEYLRAGGIGARHKAMMAHTTSEAVRVACLPFDDLIRQHSYYGRAADYTPRRSADREIMAGDCLHLMRRAAVEDRAYRDCERADRHILRESEERLQSSLLRCVVGNPFRPATADPAWLTSTVRALAGGAYADRAFDRLPILADALQDAGCEDQELLTHCRGDGPHVRGCWVIDLLLGKE